MAKKSILLRNENRKYLIERYYNTRQLLKNNIKKSKSILEIFQFSEKLQKLPRNSSTVRYKNRCWKTGRAHGYYKFFGLCRIALRELALNCLLPGVTKSSW